MYLVHPFSPWSSSSPPSISVCQHHSFFPVHLITYPIFLLSAVCCSVSSSSIPIFMRTLSLVFFSILDILCIFLHIHISHALIFFSIFFVIVHVSQPYRTIGKISVLISFFC